MWNSVQMPGGIPQVMAKESEMAVVPENEKEETGKIVLDNDIFIEENLDVVSMDKDLDTVSENTLLFEQTTEVEDTVEELVEATTEALMEETTEEATTETEIETEIETETESFGEEEYIEEETVEELTEEISTELEETEIETENEIEEQTESVSEEETKESKREEIYVGEYVRNENGISLFNGIWIEGFEKESESLCYTGEAVTQNLRIYHNDILLKEGKDYKLTYRNNINAGEYNLPNAPSVRIAMIGQYSGNQTLYFTIAPRDITNGCSYETEQIVYYKKKLTFSVPEIVFGDRKLSYKKDYDCDYATLPQDYKYGDSYEEGTDYEYTVTGKGNFTGSYTVKLFVLRDKKLDFQKVTVELDKESYEYSGVALGKTDVMVLSVKAGKDELSPGLYDYSVYANGVGSGCVKVFPSELGKEAGYAGVKELTITVVGDRKIEDAVLGTGWQESIVFSKKALEENGGIYQGKNDLLVYGPESEVLIEGVDYTVAYYNYEKIGRALVVFTGVGRYRGTLQKSYEIIPNLDLQITWQQTDEGGKPVVFYTKGELIPKFTVFENAGTEDAYALREKMDYTVKFTHDKGAGLIICKIIGKGNFEGYASISLIEILNGDIGAGTIDAQDQVFSEKENAWMASVVVRDANGTKLKAGTDYDKNLIYTYEGMENGGVPEIGATIQVTAVGINQFAGSSISTEYRICAKKIRELVIKIDDQVYTGSAVELDVADIHVYGNWLDYLSGNEITAPCYEIVGYSDNKNTGKAKVTLRGIGEYGAEKTYTFTIVKMKYEPVHVMDVVMDETDVLMGIDSQRKMSVSVFPKEAENKNILWMTSDSRIASVDKEGIITAKKPGKVTIMAVAQDGGKKTSCAVTVAIIPVRTFSLNTKEFTGLEGTMYQLSAMDIQPVDASLHTIQWESSNPDVASVDNKGAVSLNRAGMAVIKAYSADGQFVQKCMVFVEKDGEIKPEGTYLTPQMFRDSNDADDTNAFNEAVHHLSDTCNTVYVPAGIYYINAEKSIQLKSNMNLVMSDDAVLQAIGNSNSHSDVIYVRDVRNVSISGGSIKGERYIHIGSLGEWGMGIGIYDSENINVSGISISDCWGDGIYLGSNHGQDADAGNTAISITNCKLFNNRRNNLSIVSADNVIVDNCYFEYANGTAPEYGIDIETNYSSNPCEHISISDSTFTGNREAAIGIVTEANDIRICGCTINGAFINYAGTNVTLSDTAINGNIYARIGVDMINGSVVNDGSEQEDALVVDFGVKNDTYTLGEHGINNANQMSGTVVEDNDSSTGKALCFKRTTDGTQESGYYLDLRELTDGKTTLLKPGTYYRFEYVVKGSGLWGIKTNQTAWYPISPVADAYSTGFTTYKAKESSICQILFYALDKIKDIILEIESIKIYEVR